PFHLHQADPADRHGIQLVVRAEDGNLHARLARRIEHQGSRRHLHGPAVDGEADPLAAHAERTSRTWQAPRSMWARYSSSKWMRVELRKPTEASEKGQMVRPAICPGRLFKTSRSSGRPCPASIRPRIRATQLVPSRQGVHWPQDSAAKNRART